MFDLDVWRTRWQPLDAVLRVNDRFTAIRGGTLASSIALATFVSMFPLLLVTIAVFGFLSSSRADFAVRLIDDLGLAGTAAQTVQDALSAAQDSRRAASVVGLVGLVWSGLGVAGAIQGALNAAWQVQGRGLLDRAVALRWLIVAGSLFLATASLGAVLSWVPGPVLPLTILAGLALTASLFVWTYASLGNSRVGWRAHLPGALLVAAGVEVLKVVGSLYLPRLIASSSALYGSLGVVFAVLAWLLVYARLVVYGAVVNVLRYEAGHGTVTAEIEVPRVAGGHPVSTTRGGAVET